MAEILLPLWEFLFDAFGIFGIFIAFGIIGFIFLILILLIKAIVGLFKINIKPSRNIQQRKPITETFTNTTQTKSEITHSETPKSDATVKKTETYKTPSFQDYLERAEKGEAFAQCCCGSMYEHGDSVTKDINKAIYWFKKAGDQGHSLSNYRLGMIYFEGRNTDVDLNLAEKYLTYAAEGEDDGAQYQLAMLYSKKNEILCKEMGYTTSDQRLSDSRYNENKEKYKYWLKKAAANGNMDAEYILY